MRIRLSPEAKLPRAEQPPQKSDCREHCSKKSAARQAWRELDQELDIGPNRRDLAASGCHAIQSFPARSRVEPFSDAVQLGRDPISLSLEY
jgi:hypothetical protein